MSRELAVNRLRHVSTDNCYISAICTIIHNQGLDHVLDPLMVKKALPVTNEFYFDKIKRLLKEKDLVHLNHDILLLPDIRKDFIHAVVAALDGGALCSLTAWSDSWVNGLRGEKVKIKPDDIHAIVVYGYYQPDTNSGLVWFYIYDPYDDQQIFIRADQVYSSLVFYQDELGRKKNGTFITLFGLGQDPTNLLTRYRPPIDYVEECDKKKILCYLSGRSHKEKLSQIFTPRESTWRRQN